MKTLQHLVTVKWDTVDIKTMAVWKAKSTLCHLDLQARHLNYHSAKYDIYLYSALSIPLKLVSLYETASEI